MAGLQNSSSIGPHTFDKNLVRDVNDFHLSSQSWGHARNAINNSKTGDLGKIGNEPANTPCAFNSLTGQSLIPYQVIGAVYLEADTWTIFSTNGTNSEIGIFVESTCTYTTVVNADCLKFSAEHLIKGGSRATSDCVYEVYWDDGSNPSRYISIDIRNPLNNLPFLPPPAPPGTNNPNSPLPWVQICNNVNGCQICVNTAVLDCDKLRVAKFITPPCIEVAKGISGGTLLNGSYFILTAYAIRGQKISDYTMSNVQPLFEHDNSASSLDVIIKSADTRFDEMIVVLVSIVNQQTVARQAGIYSTHQQRLSFDIIQNDWPSVPIEQIPITTPIYDKSDAMFTVGQYLIRVGPTSKIDFNYQPLANQIVAKWVAVEYPAKYYRRGGSNTGYLRDEIYAFFIRWIYDTGDKSSSYHIPGRPPTFQDLNIGPGIDTILQFNETQLWQSTNTAVQTTFGPQPALADGGIPIAEGLMGYWESSENYPDDKPQIWDANIPTSPYATYGSLNVVTGTAINFNSILGNAHNLCGKKIRHHKFPEDALTPETKVFNSGVGDTIRIMGVKFENIKRPVDFITGLPITNIVGYEILRGSRNGNKTIIAKGMLNNIGVYPLQDQLGPGGIQKFGAYANYPYNDLNADPFLSTTQTTSPGTFQSVFGNLQQLNYTPLTPYSGNNAGPANFVRNYQTFHSPETNFTKPYLDAKEVKVYGNIHGEVVGKFEYSEKHPKEKLMTNLAFAIAATAGVGIAAIASNGKRRTVYRAPESPGYSVQGRSGILTDNKTTVGTPLTNFTNVAVIPFLFNGVGVPSNIGPAPAGFSQNVNLQNTGTSTETAAVGIGSSPTPADAPLLVTAKAAIAAAANTAVDTPIDTGALALANIAGLTIDTLYIALNGAYAAANTTTALSSWGKRYEQEDGDWTNTPAGLRAFGGFPLFINYYTQGTDTIINFIKAVLRYQDFALRYESHAFYNNFDSAQNGNRRRFITDEAYIGNERVQFGTGNNKLEINNLYRTKTVALELDPSGIGGFNPPLVFDKSRYRVTDVTGVSAPVRYSDPSKYNVTRFNTTYSVPAPGIEQTASSHYAALKQRLVNQYGQLTEIYQLHASQCMQSILINGVQQPISKSEVIFGGDTYIGRYTEKNTFFYFYDWLYGQNDGAQLNYDQLKMFAGLFPRYWANFNQFETSDFTGSIFPSLAGWITGGPTPNLILPNDFYSLDGNVAFTSSFRIGMKNAWMYLFNSGVKDFFVESEINIDLRDWGNIVAERHYDPYGYGDLKQMFDTDIIKAANYYKYDFSLSISKLFINYVSWANTQTRDYNPYLAETCYNYRPRRVIYSLPAQFEGRKDNWLIFLSNNYFDFLANVTAIKSVNKSGAIILFDTASPVEFQGTDQLQTSLGTKLTIGDGGLFSQPMQSLSNADGSYEYGSCQDRLSVMNTPAGIFWMNQASGKIYHLSGGIKEISNSDLKWWFTNYLPYKLTELFPTYDLVDNPVIGIGCQSVYDNENGLAYFCKKDYILKAPFTPAQFQYMGSNKFKYLPTGLIVNLGDSDYFEDASWTVSYDPKIGEWLGWHDWHPELTLPGKNTFMSIVTNKVNKRGGIWKHNERCDLYCNYYGVDYPFEIEYMINTPQQVNTLRSIEYYMEVYKYDQNCYDRFHVLDYNFDEAVIYNTEQVSGMLRLNPSPRNNPGAMIGYPIVNPTSIEILYSKIENKYRFNQFWDITDDRGEYPLYPAPPVAQRMIWNTGANGYAKTLNPANLNYNKPELQRKKFRHYTNSVFLRKRVIFGQQMRYKMLLSITDNKNLNSPR